MQQTKVELSDETLRSIVKSINSSTQQPDPHTLHEVLHSIWEMLAGGAAGRSHPFHTVALATADNERVDVRTVVLRGVSKQNRELTFHTDRRSQKIISLHNNPSVAWLFYDQEAAVQVRLKASATVHTDSPLTREHWRSLSNWSRRCYCATQAPSTVTPIPATELPEHLLDIEPTDQDLVDARGNFAVIETVCTRIDWLKLASGGHRRTRFSWDGHKWQGTWVTP